MNQHPLEMVPSKSEKRYLQSRHEIFRPTPLSIAFCGISTSGKSSQMTTVANLLFPIMDNIVLISHTHREDPAWGPLKQRIEERQISRGEHPDTHPFVFENLTQLPAIIALQRERVREDKENNAPHVRQLLLILDDLLGDMSHSKILDSVVTRGRHAGISILASSQTIRGLSSAQRKNFSAWALGKLSAADWRVFEDEHAGSWVTREQLRELYKRATQKKYGFLYYRPRSNDLEHMFYANFTERLLVS